MNVKLNSLNYEYSWLFKIWVFLNSFRYSRFFINSNSSTDLLCERIITSFDRLSWTESSTLNFLLQNPMWKKFWVLEGSSLQIWKWKEWVIWYEKIGFKLLYIWKASTFTLRETKVQLENDIERSLAPEEVWPREQTDLRESPFSTFCSY